MADTPMLFLHAGVAAGLGMLVGLQRERAGSELAGIRTFPLISLTGFVCAILGQHFGGWVVAAGFIAVAALVLTGNLLRMRDPQTDSGITTETACVLMFGVGALLVAAPLSLGVAVGAGTAALLHFKSQLHGISGKLSDKDAKLIMQFALIALVILPALPNRAFGPFEVFNPYKTWWLVVLIASISAMGYVALKLLGARVGSILGGLLGGLISSTATTASFARRTKESPGADGVAAVVIAIASTVSLARVLTLAAFIAPASLREMGPPLGVMLALMALISIGMIIFTRSSKQEMPEPGNPAELGSALIFAGLFVVISFAVTATEHYFGNEALYVVAAVSGLTDMDAITLSTAGLVQKQTLDVDTGWRLILLAMLANIVFKFATMLGLGTRGLWVRSLPYFGITLIAGVGVLLGWNRISALVGQG